MKLSVLVPAFNTANSLPRCLDSLLAQETMPDEVLLVDDGSDDGRTGEICDDYARRFPALIRAIHTPNRGVGAARNTCVQEARGDYVLFVDSDDAVSPRMVGTLIPFMEKGIDVVVFSFRIDLEGRGTFPADEAPPCGSFGSLAQARELLLAAPAPWNKLWKKELFLKNGILFPTGIVNEDLATTGRLLAAASGIEVIPDVLYDYTERRGSIMRSRNTKRDRDVMTALRILAEWFREQGLFERYRNELEAVAVLHGYLAASVRVLRADPADPLLRELEEFVRANCPGWPSNPYVRRFPAKRRLLLLLLRRHRYRLIRLLFDLKDRLRGGRSGGKTAKKEGAA